MNDSHPQPHQGGGRIAFSYLRWEIHSARISDAKALSAAPQNELQEKAPAASALNSPQVFPMVSQAWGQQVRRKRASPLSRSTPVFTVSAPAGPTSPQLQQVSESPGGRVWPKQTQLGGMLAASAGFQSRASGPGPPEASLAQSQEQPFGKLCDLTHDKRNEELRQAT